MRPFEESAVGSSVNRGRRIIAKTLTAVVRVVRTFGHLPVRGDGCLQPRSPRPTRTDDRIVFPVVMVARDGHTTGGTTKSLSRRGYARVGYGVPHALFATGVVGDVSRHISSRHILLSAERGVGTTTSRR